MEDTASSAAATYSSACCPVPSKALAAASEALLETFVPAIDGAARPRAAVIGRQSLPFHALPWRGQPLLMHADVETSLDLPAP